VIAPEAGFSRILLAGAILGAAIGATAATLIDAKSGPAFWAGLAAGAVVGPLCLVALAGAVDLVQNLRRGLHRP
jgi:hypothetical protein